MRRHRLLDRRPSIGEVEDDRAGRCGRDAGRWVRMRLCPSHRRLAQAEPFHNSTTSTRKQPPYARIATFAGRGSRVVVSRNMRGPGSAERKIMRAGRHGCGGRSRTARIPRAPRLRAMEVAMKRSGLDLSDIDYINAHGTSTPLGDELELGAVRRLFGNAVGKLSMSSTKSAIGHLLGGAGAVEAIFCILAMRDQIVPPTLNLDNPSDGTAESISSRTSQGKARQGSAQQQLRLRRHQRQFGDARSLGLDLRAHLRK